MDKNLNIRISEELLKKYKKFCKTNGYSISERIRSFIEVDMKPKLNTDKLSAAVISRFPEAGIPNGPLPNGKENPMEKYTTTLIEEIINAIQKDARIEI